MGNVTAKKGTITKKYVAVSGDTLEAIQDDLFRADTKIGGTDGIGDCTTGVSVPAIRNFVEKENKKPKTKGTVEYTLTAKSGPKVELTATITLPQLKSDKKLTDKGKKEWQRFIGALTAHEDAHLAAALKVAEAIATELSEMKAVGVGKDKKAAINAAKAKFATLHKDKYGGAKVKNRVTAAHKALDPTTFTLDVNKQ
jgi:predicted secreted Zn-dependent protease